MIKLQLSSDTYQFLTEQEKESFFIGRLGECDFVVQDSTVSRKHAELFCRPAGWFVRDLDSKHGIWVNGIPVKMTRLKDGDELQLGELVLNVRVIRESHISSGRLQSAAAEAADAEPRRPVFKIGGTGNATTMMRNPPKR